MVSVMQLCSCAASCDRQVMMFHKRTSQSSAIYAASPSKLCLHSSSAQLRVVLTFSPHWSQGLCVKSDEAKTCTLDARTDGFDLPEAPRISKCGDQFAKLQLKKMHIIEAGLAILANCMSASFGSKKQSNTIIDEQPYIALLTRWRKSLPSCGFYPCHPV